MAKKRTLAEADAEIAALRAQLVAAGTSSGTADAPFQRYPCVMYKRHRVDEKHPNGYERRRVQETDAKGELNVEKCDAQAAQLEKQGWAHSPADITA